MSSVVEANPTVNWVVEMNVRICIIIIAKKILTKASSNNIVDDNSIRNRARKCVTIHGETPRDWS